jgi:raffinose/stachyose/melibiose transport system substrate-binding protein
MHGGWARIVAVVMAIGSIAACSQGSSQPSAPTALSVVAWKGGGTEVAGMDQLNQAFQKAHPEVKLEYKYVSPDYETYVNTRLAAGQAPDVLMADRYKMIKWYKQGYLADLSDQPWVSRMYPNLKDFNSIKGKTYQLNSENAAVGLYANLDLLKEAGIDKAPATWPDLLADLSTLKARNMNGIMLANKGGWMGITLSQELASNLVEKGWAGKYDAGQSSFNPAWTPVIDRIKALLNSGTIDSKLMLGLDPWTDGPAQFKSGKWAFFVQGAWQLSDFTKGVNFNFSLNPFPGGDAGTVPKNFTFVGAGWVVNSHAKNPGAAKAYLNFMSQPKNSAVFLAAESGFSTLVDVESPAIPQAQPVLATFKKGNTVPSHLEQLNYTDGETELGKAIQSIFVNPSISTASLLQTLDTQIPKSPIT